MIKRLEALIGVRAVICMMLISATFALFYFKITEGATAMMTLASIAVKSMFDARADREKK